MPWRRPNGYPSYGIDQFDTRLLTLYCTPAIRNARCSRSVAACNAMMACL